MSGAAPWLVLTPALTAALLVFTNGHTPRWLADALAIAASLAIAILALSMAASAEAAATVWAGWEPTAELAFGIPLLVDAASLSAVAYTGGLAALTFLFGWRHFDAFGTLYHALVLLMVTGACGFFLAGDLWNLFVFMELASVASYGLAAYRVEDPEPVQGGLELAVLGSIGGIFLLFGVALLYGAAGRLDLAGLGAALAAAPEGGLVAAGVALVAVALLMKAGAVPFHFAHVSAHATAPTPALVLLAAVLLEMGVFGLGRAQGLVFGPALGAAAVLEQALIWIGALGAAACGLFALLQDHLKRLLAFVALSQVGSMIVAIGAGGSAPGAAQGLVLYAGAHGCVLALAFLSSGVMVADLETASVRELWRAGRKHRVSAAVFAASALAIAGLPLTGLASGEHRIVAAAASAGFAAVAPALLGATALCGAAALRATGCLLGWGERPERDADDSRGGEHPDLDEAQRARPTMIAALVLLAAAALCTGLVPLFERAAGRAGSALWAGTIAAPTGASVAAGASVASMALAVAIAALLLWPGRFGLGRAAALARPLRHGLHAIHSGSVGEYVAWAVLGGGALAALLSL